MGDLTNELTCKDVQCKVEACPNDHYIVEFVSAGPKNYAFRTDTGNVVCKVRGFSLNFANSQKINIETMKQMVFGEVSEIVTKNKHKITRNKKQSKIVNRHEVKHYKFCYKRVIQPDFDTLPYGY